MKCPKCGAELTEDTKFCSYCGNKIETTVASSTEEKTVMSDTVPYETVRSNVVKSDISRSVVDKLKDKGVEKRHKLRTYGKRITVIIAAVVLLSLAAFLFGKTSVSYQEKNVKETSIDEPEYDVSIEIECTENLLFSKYDVNVYIGDMLEGTIRHGTTETFNMILTKGTYEIKFVNTENKEVTGSVEIDIHQDEVLRYKISCASDSISVEMNKRTEKNGFDSAANEIYNLARYTIEIPEYWKSEMQITGGIQRYAETGEKVAMLQLFALKDDDDSYPVTFDGLMDDNKNMIKAIESTALSKVTDYEVIDTGVIKGILYKGTIQDRDSGLLGNGEYFVFPSEEDRNWCTLIVIQTDNTDYSYTDDFMKMIQSIRPREGKIDDLVASETQLSEITLTMSEDDFVGMTYQEAEKIFREMGFSIFEYKTVSTENEDAADTICYIEIKELLIGDSEFAQGDKFDANSTVIFYSYEYEAPTVSSPVSYSNNDYETAKKGDSGVFSYMKRESSYDIYWIIDFDEGYVYYFTDGNGESTCDRLMIDSGTLNDKITITYHDGEDEWSYRLHFKYVNHPETLVMVDNNGFDYEYSTTDLDNALSLRDAKSLKDY